MNAHTPGPWAIHKHSSTAVVGSSGFVVAACGGFSSNTIDAGQLSEELEANTRLVAAAPELLEMLHRLEVSANSVAYCYDKRPENFAAALAGLQDDAEAARAVIAKATGAKP